MVITKEKFDELAVLIESMTEEEIHQALERAYEDTKDEPTRNWEEN